MEILNFIKGYLKNKKKKFKNFIFNSNISDLNERALLKKKIFLEKKLSKEEALKEHNLLKHKFPFYGNVNIKIGRFDISLFSVNDDVVAWNLFWLETYEEKLLETWLDMTAKGGLALDIGAYSGIYSILAAKNGCSVKAYELIPRTAERAKINFILNNVDKKVELFNFGISNENSIKKVYMPRKADFLGTGNSLDKKENINVVEETFCFVKSGKDLVNTFEKKVSSIKIDVEGHETIVLESIEELIKRDKPEIIIEITNDNLKRCEDLLSKNNYRIEKIFGINYLAKQK